jgi:hypothetical protein
MLTGRAEPPNFRPPNLKYFLRTSLYKINKADTCECIHYNYHLFTETEGNSVVCGPETAVVSRRATTGGPGPQNTLLSRGLSK